MTSDIRTLEHRLIRQLVINILEDPHTHGWTWQGLGMLRAYLDADRTMRLHIWDQEQAAPDVSTVHSHPWDFESYVVCGVVDDLVFKQVPDNGTPMNRQTIQCGTGGGLVGKVEKIQLALDHEECRYTLGSGETYNLFRHQLHRSVILPGTVTIIRRQFHADTEHAYVCWPADEKWVSAEPRTATPDEIDRCAQLALRRMNAQ